MTDDISIPIGCVVMAAGNAERFGQNKLSAVFRGKTLLEYALEAVPADRLAAVCVVTQYPEAEASARRYGFRCVRNDRPERGAGFSVRLGVEALGDRCRGIMFQVADQPLLRRESVTALVELFCAHPDRIAAMAHNGVRGNPCIFPAEFYPELCALEGDTGGSAVIRRHPERLLLLEVDPKELADVDTPQQLSELEK